MSMNLQCSDEDFRTDMASSDSEDDSDEEEERHGNFVDDGSTAAAVSDQIFHLSEEKHRDTGCPEDFLFGHDCDDPVPSLNALVVHLLEVHGSTSPNCFLRCWCC